MFKLYLFFSDMRDVYNEAEDGDSVNVLDMAERLWAGYSREQLLGLRDACLFVSSYIEKYLTSRE